MASHAMAGVENLCEHGKPIGQDGEIL